MAPLDSPITSYSDTTPHKRAITDAISLIDPADTVAIDLLGGLDGAMSKFRFVNWPHTKVEWLEDTFGDLVDALSTSITSTTTTISVVDASIFQLGDVILIGSEQMWVSGVTLSTELLAVTREYGGTSATAAASAAITIVGRARLEGADSTAVAFSDRTAPFNYTQILQKEVKVSRTQNQLSQYGIAAEYDYQVEKVVPELGRLLERQLYYGQRKAGSATTPRAMGGFGTFITTNKQDAATITQADVENAVEAAFGAGGSGPWIAFCNPASVQLIKNLYDSSNFLRIDRAETTMGMVIERVLTPFGEIDLALDRWATTSEIYLVDPDHAGFLTYYPFTHEMLSRTGDSIRGEVVGEFTFCLRNDAAHAVLTAVS